ncbi:MAG: PTS sugar transporter subunit IIC [Clostridia bacterium]|nr:PTS sugar transporter subunit IIC [Clostridia bacterium]
MQEQKQSKIRAFLDKKGITLSPKLYFVDAMSAMALGLFASLLMGTIFGTVATLIPEGNVIYDFFKLLSTAGGATGAMIGVAVAYSLKAPTLVMLSAGVVGMIGNSLGTTVLFDGVEKSVTAGPLGAFVCVLVAVEVAKLVSKATKVDILVTPAVTIGAGGLVGMLACPAIAWAMYWLGYFINYATELLPFFMGIIISVVVGIVLTLPISSAALCAMIGITGIAGGAAVVGCCAQMVGFAVISFRENKWGGVVAQGLGTSMLQMGNIVKNPLIWIPATLASAITGPISTCLFKLECSGVSAGMGTCGLVGPIGIITDMGVTPTSVIGILVVCIILPAVLSLIFSEIMRKLGWIKMGDMKLDL